MYHTYRAPQTEDGVITRVSSESADALQIEVSFDFPDEFSGFEPADMHFACRSRIARLGIDIRPLSQVEIRDKRATLVAVLLYVLSLSTVGFIITAILGFIDLILTLFCKAGSSHPSAQAFPVNNASRHLAVYDPKTQKLTHISTCFGTHHLMFAEDANNTLWTSGGGQVVGWLNTKMFFETKDAGRHRDGGSGYAGLGFGEHGLEAPRLFDAGFSSVSFSAHE
jgi:hypothetical protein